MPLLVPPITAIANLRTALIVLFPMLYLISSGLFLVAYIVHKMTNGTNSATMTTNKDTEQLIEGKYWKNTLFKTIIHRKLYDDLFILIYGYNDEFITSLIDRIVDQNDGQVEENIAEI